MPVDLLRARVHTLCRLADHTLGELAQALALHPKVLSRKLNRAGDARLTHAEGKRLIITLAQWQAIATRQEAHELMALLGLPSAAFSSLEWEAAPLAQLEVSVEPVALPATSSTQTAPPRHNLPASMTRLIGRECAVDMVQQLLQQPAVRLVTLLGPGGVGKTSLGLAVAQGLVDCWADGVAFVALAGVTNPALVVPTIAQNLGVRDEPDVVPLVQLTAYLRSRELLLVLDNLEQVIEAATEIGELLAQAPGLTVLATSRTALQLYGEREWSVPPLDVPALHHLPSTLDQLGHYAAIRLFVERVQAVRPTFVLTLEQGAVIAAICARLDGLPLAIELAAARTKMLTPSAILEQLMTGRWTVLSGGARNLPARHQTMQATIDWSYNLLDEAEQGLFRRLAVFIGGWSLEALGVTSGLDDPFLLLGRLVDQSLVVVEHNVAGAGRYRMLEPIRQYALERLQAHGEWEAVRSHHAQYYTALAEMAKPELTGPHQEVWFQQLEVEYDNLRAALSWLVSNNAGELSLRVAGSLWRFWDVRGYLNEGRKWLAQTLNVPAAELSPARIEVLKGAGTLASRQGEYRRAQAFHEAALELAQARGDHLSMAHTLNNLGCEALELGEVAQAATVWEECLRLYQSFGDQRGIGNVLDNLGELAQGQGDYQRARQLHEESLALHRVIGDVRGIAVNLNNLGSVLCELGEYAKAGALFRESLLLCQGLGEKGVMARALEGQAMVVGAQGDVAGAARLWGAAAAMRDDLGVPMSPSILAQQAREQQRVRDQMDAALWASAWQAGRAMPSSQAVEYALAREGKAQQ